MPIYELACEDGHRSETLQASSDPLPACPACGRPTRKVPSGFGEGDIPDLVEGTMKQQRLLATCPREVTEDDIAGIFRRSMSLW